MLYFHKVKNVYEYYISNNETTFLQVITHLKKKLKQTFDVGGHIKINKIDFNKLSKALGGSKYVFKVNSPNVKF